MVLDIAFAIKSANKTHDDDDGDDDACYHFKHLQSRVLTKHTTRHTARLAVN